MSIEKLRQSLDKMKEALDITNEKVDVVPDKMKMYKFKGQSWPFKVRPDIAARGGINGKGTQVNIWVLDQNEKPKALGYQGPFSEAGLKKMIAKAMQRGFVPNPSIKSEMNNMVEAEDLKSLIKNYGASGGADKKAEKSIRSQLKKMHSEIVKDFDSEIKSAMVGELKRLKSKYKDFDIKLHPVSKRAIKDVEGNSDSTFGDWYDSLDYRLVVTYKA